MSIFRQLEADCKSDLDVIARCAGIASALRGQKLDDYGRKLVEELDRITDFRIKEGYRKFRSDSLIVLRTDVKEWA